MINCSNCKNNGTQICSVCCSYQGYPDRWEAKPKTNADRIRAMTDEELTKWVSDIGIDCAYCKIETLCYKLCKCFGDCEKAWGEWLKQPYNEKGENT